MNIHVGYHFDGGAYPDPLTCAMAAEGVDTLGPLGLLGLLETRLGLPGSQLSQTVRIAQLARAMAETCASAEPFYAASFRQDAWATAQRLLQLRDQLALSGWDGLAPTGLARLEDLAELESTVRLAPGLAERLQRVHEIIGKHGLPGVSCIVLQQDVPLWPSCWKRLLAQLAEHGVVITTAPMTQPEGDTDLATLQRGIQTGKPAAAPAGDGSVVLLQSPTLNQAADFLAAWLAADPENNGNVLLLAASRSETLNAALTAHGLPRVQDGPESPWRSTLQLLPLALQLLWKPFNPSLMLEFLTSRPCPVHPALAGKLVKALTAEPGTGGPEWTTALESCAAWAADRDDGASLMEDLGFWTGLAAFDHNAGVDAKAPGDVRSDRGQGGAASAHSAVGAHDVHRHWPRRRHGRFR